MLSQKHTTKGHRELGHHLLHVAYDISSDNLTMAWGKQQKLYFWAKFMFLFLHLLSLSVASFCYFGINFFPLLFLLSMLSMYSGHCLLMTSAHCLHALALHAWITLYFTCYKAFLQTPSKRTCPGPLVLVHMAGPYWAELLCLAPWRPWPAHRWQAPISRPVCCGQSDRDTQ